MLLGQWLAVGFPCEAGLRSCLGDHLPMRRDYEVWLVRQGYQNGTITAQLHRAGRVEQEYGDLDRHHAVDRFAAIVEELTYSTEDERLGKPNPSRIPFVGVCRTNLASYKHAVLLYRRFLDEGHTEGPSAEATVPQSPTASGKHRIAESRAAGVRPHVKLTNIDRLSRMKLLIATGLESFVVVQLTKHFGSGWRQHARMPDRLISEAKLDAHALLYALQSNWHDVFRHALPPQARSAIAAALDGRNAEAHATDEVESHRALRALSAAADLLQLVGADPHARAAAELRDGLIRELAGRV